MGKLAYTVDNIDALPEALREYYIEDKETGGFHLDTDKKMVPAARLSEFRDKNIQQQKILDDLTKKYEGVDPDEFKKLKAGVVEELDEKVRDRTKAFADENNQLKQMLEQQTSSYQNSMLETAISMAASQHNVRPEAVIDVINRAKANFRFDEQGKPIAWDSQKNEPQYDTDGVSIVNPDRYVAKLVKQAPHFFVPSTGGSSPGSKANGAVKPPPRNSIDAFKQGLSQMGYDSTTDE